MATLAQLHANRLNAQSSTGPRSDQGKGASRFNALKHGLEARSLVIPGEDPAELEALALDYHAQFNPVGPLEDYLVDTLVQSDWARRRWVRLEAQVTTIMLAEQGAGAEPQFAPFTGTEPRLIFRRLAAAERSYFRALKELGRAQQARQAQDEEPCGEPAAVSNPAPASPAEPPIGFVPPICVRPVSQPAGPPQAAPSTTARPPAV